MLAYAIIAGVARMCIPVLFKQISDDLGLSVFQVGVIWGMDPLAGVFVGLPAGLLADRFGVKRTITVLCILAGIFSALRGLSNSFVTMAMTMFLFGLMAAATPSIVPKVTTEWFSGKRLGLANALLNIAWSVGSILASLLSATVLSPWLGGWRNVIYFFSAPAVLLGLLWWFTGKEPERSQSSITRGQISFKQSLSHVIRMKQVWLIGIATLFTWGASMGFLGYLPLYLRNIGWSDAAADSAITVFNGVTLIGSIPMVLLSDKLKTRKGVLGLSLGALAVGLIALPYINTIGVWLMIGICGFLRSGTGSLFNVMIFETKSIGSTYGGTAIGLASTISMIGAFIAPGLGNSLDSVSQGAPFVFWGILAALAVPVLFFIKTDPNKSLVETG
jgi:NNP family nitrate/nitrite transporter-like MFS transporter